MADAEFDTSEMRSLIVSLETMPVRMRQAARVVVKDAIRDLRDEWRDNARVTAGRHGWRYPGTITDDVLPGGMNAVAGPESNRWQGGMGPGFEFGSRNQTRPHLDGNIATDTITPRFERRVAIVAEDVFRT